MDGKPSSRIEIYYFSLTGDSKKIAQTVAERLGLKLKEIRGPKIPYIFWLTLSFLPLLPIPARFQPPAEPNLILVFPKWTINCPLISFFYLYCFWRRYRFKRTLLIVSYGGFLGRIYLKWYVLLFRVLSESVCGLLVRRSERDELMPEVLKWVAEKIT